MKKSAFWMSAMCSLAIAALLLGDAGTAHAQTAPRTVQPGAPGEVSRVLEPDDESVRQRPGHTEADVRFMQGMIHHHAQALQMISLVRPRTNRDDVLALARRIEASQEAEIDLMKRWLADRGEEVPDRSPAGTSGHSHHHSHRHHHPHHDHDPGHDHDLMPGMLTHEQLAQLAAASNEEFDRLFLEFMIFHHEGALIMVDELFASEGAGQESVIFNFASHVDADQAIEIARMRAMLNTSPQTDTK